MQLHYWVQRVLLASALVCHAAAFTVQTTEGERIVSQLTAAFGPSSFNFKASLSAPNPVQGCVEWNLTESNPSGKIALVQRGVCSFFHKVALAQQAGALGVIVGNDRSNAYVQMGATEGDNVASITIPSVFISRDDYLELVAPGIENVNVTLNRLGEVSPDDPYPTSTSLQTVGLLLMILPVVWCAIVGGYYCRRMFSDRRVAHERTHRSRDLPVMTYHMLPGSATDRPTEQGAGADTTVPPAAAPQRQRSGSSAAPVCVNESCAICLDDFAEGTEVKVLPCQHGFHAPCIDPWLLERSEYCPICKRSILDAPEPAHRCCPMLCC